MHFHRQTFRTVFNAEGLHRNILLICTLNAAVTKVFICLYKVCICMSAQIKFKFAVYVIKFIFEMFVDKLNINVSCCMN